MDGFVTSKTLALAALLMIVSLGGCRQTESRADAPPPIEIKATVHPAQEATILAQIDGQVRTLGVRQGAAVTANASVAELTNPAVERDAAVAHAQLEWNETRQRRRGHAPVVKQSATSRDDIALTARILEVKQKQLEKMKQLRRTNDVSSREVEQAEVEYLAALRDYNQQRRVFSGVVAAPADDPELLRIEHDKLAAEEKFARDRQALLHVASPIAGTVTRVAVTQGQAVFPRDVIAEVADTTTLHVTGSIAPELLRYIRPGMPVQVKIFSVPPRTFADEIDSVIPVQSGDANSRSATVVVSIPNPDHSVQPNTDALITLRTQ